MEQTELSKLVRKYEKLATHYQLLGAEFQEFSEIFGVALRELSKPVEKPAEAKTSES